MTRYLGVDYGTKRIGLAISDGLGLTARPLEVVAKPALADALQRIAEEYQPQLVVVGLPRPLQGGENESTAGARQLGREIGEMLGVPVEFVDERFTSRIAESALLEADMRRRDRKETVDKVAAAIILQTYLDSERRHRDAADEPGPETESR